jgi:hypothetical protein
MNEHDLWQNLSSCSQCTNIITNKMQHDSDPILGIEVATYCQQPEDNTSTGCFTRHAKKQRLANRDDDQSKITYINGGTNVEYGSHNAMMTSPSFDGGWDNDMSSTEQWKLYWHRKMLPHLHHTIPVVSPPPMILFSHHLTENAN